VGRKRPELAGAGRRLIEVAGQAQVARQVGQGVGVVRLHGERPAGQGDGPGALAEEETGLGGVVVGRDEGRAGGDELLGGLEPACPVELGDVL
jgi:hypothetical protein